MTIRKKILYADDDLDDQIWIMEALEHTGHEPQIHFVNNGRQALDYLQQQSDLPSLIVLDLNMPELDGRQTLQKLKSSERFAPIPVAVVTTSASRIDADVCMRLGAALFLTKPDTHSEWQQIVQQLLSVLS